MAVTASRDGNTITISFGDSFNFNARDSFLNSYKNEQPNCYFVLDFRKTQNIDSSALGMLMIFREFAGGEAAKITLANCSAQLTKMFEIAQFNTLFKMT